MLSVEKCRMAKHQPRLSRGFSLIELMVALVVGLIVIGAVLALTVAIMKSNRQTVQSTRLNQELRATMSVIANDLRRARGVSDPFTEVKLADVEKYGRNIDYTTAGCIRFGYAEDGVATCHAIMRASAGANLNRIFIASVVPVTVAGSAGPPVVPKTVTCNTTCPAAGAGTRLGSDQVAITALTFTPRFPAAPTAGNVRSFDVSVTGSLIDADTELSSISRTITQTVFIPSVGDE